MINNRNQSTVRGMKWTPDGSRICIVYEDGMVIVGSNDGNRLWGKEIKSGDLAHVEWSPDGRNLLFCTAACEVHVYDAHGNFVANLPLYCLESVAGPTALAGVHWYDGAEGLLAIDQPVLAIGLQNGRLQLMRHEVDEEPVLVDSGMTVAELHWSTNGSMLAVSGGEHLRDWAHVGAHRTGGPGKSGALPIPPIALPSRTQATAAPPRARARSAPSRWSSSTRRRASTCGRSKCRGPASRRSLGRAARCASRWRSTPSFTLPI